MTDSAIKRDPKLLSGVSPDVAEKAGRLRGAAAQQTHFAEVYDNTAKVIRRGRTPGLIAATAGAGGLAASRMKPKKKQPVSKLKRNMSDAEIRRRKKIQGTISHATGTLGLTALGGTLLATKTGSKGTKAAFKLIDRQRPKALKPKNLKRGVAPLLATGAGIGGAGSFNFAAYTNAESRKRKQVTVKKSHEVMFAGEEGSAEAYEAELVEFEKSKFPTKTRKAAESFTEHFLEASAQDKRRRRKRKVKKSYPLTVSAFGVEHG